MADRNAYGKPMPASPGFKGAVKDAVTAIAKATAPKSLPQRGRRIDEETDRQAGDGERMRRNQTTDSNN